MKTKFTDTHFNAKTKAQNNLTGLTHYADDNTLKYFNCRILECDILASSNDSLLLIVERLPIGGFDAKRKTRAVCFDVFGTVIYRSDNGFSTTKAAKDDFYNWYNNFDINAHMIKAIEHQVKIKNREIDILNDLMSQFD